MQSKDVETFQNKNQEFKTTHQSLFITRKIVGHDDLNANGTLFGGKIMAWMDEIAFMTARRFSGKKFVVTANVDNITFAIPLYQGEHLLLTSQVNYAGRTSMEIGVKVEREDPFTGECAHATSAYFTFVALDENQKPTAVPKLILESQEDFRRHVEAIFRLKVRERMRRHFLKKLRSENSENQQQRFKDRQKTCENTSEVFPQYYLSRKLKELGAPEWSRAVDKQALFIERSFIQRLKMTLN